MAINKNIEKFIGRGITFPVVLSKGAAQNKTGVELLRSSLRILLSWPSFSRFFLAEYGSRADELLEEPNDLVLRQIMRQFIIDSVSKFEKRVQLSSVRVKQLDGTMFVKLTYRILNTNEEDSFIFPFYDKIKY